MPESRISDPVDRRVCGPNIDPQLTSVLGDIESYFNGLSFPAKYVSCNAITFPLTALMAWDILELFIGKTGNTRWLRSPPFAGKCGIPVGVSDIESPAACSSSVRVGGKCNLAGTANYSMLGMIARLCGPYTPKAMEHGLLISLVYAWKTVEAAANGGKWDDPKPAIEFAIAVYDGGASARPPTENRPACSESCDESAIPKFNFRWLPFH